MPVLSTYAASFPRLYRTDEEEVRVISREALRSRGGIGTIDPNDPSIHWWPSSVDFREEAARHGRPHGVGSFQDLVRLIRRNQNLSDVLWFGHGGRSGLIQFDANGTNNLTRDNLPSQRVNVAANFAPGGRVLFYGCNMGQARQFVNDLARNLGVQVCCFDRGVVWDLQWAGTSPRRQIIFRGIRNGIASQTPSITAVP